MDWNRHACVCLIEGKHDRDEYPKECQEGTEIFTSKDFTDIDPKKIIIFQKIHCFHLPSLYNWVINEKHFENPLTREPITFDDIQYIEDEANKRFPMRVDIYKIGAKIAYAIIETTTLINRVGLFWLILKKYKEDDSIATDSIFVVFLWLFITGVKFIIDNKEDDYIFLTDTTQKFKKDVLRVDVQKKLTVGEMVKRAVDIMNISENLYMTTHQNYEDYDEMMKSYQKFLENYEENLQNATTIRIEFKYNNDPPFIVTRRVKPQDIYETFLQLYNRFYKSPTAHSEWHNVFSIIQGETQYSAEKQINDDGFPYEDEEFREFLNEREIVITVYDWYRPPDIEVDINILGVDYEPFLFEPEDILDLFDDDDGDIVEFARGSVGDFFDEWNNSTFKITEFWTGENEQREGIVGERNPIIDVVEILKKHQEHFEQLCTVPIKVEETTEKVTWKFKIELK
jgi:hypothetical protein